MGSARSVSVGDCVWRPCGRLPRAGPTWTFSGGANVITGGPVVLARLTAALLIVGGLGLMLGAVPAVRRFRSDMPELQPAQPQPAELTSGAPAPATAG